MSETQGKNGNSRKDPRFLLQVGILAVAITGAFFTLKATVDSQAAQSKIMTDHMQKQIENKVGLSKYEECMKRLDNRLDEIADRQARIESKLDRALEK